MAWPGKGVFYSVFSAGAFFVFGCGMKELNTKEKQRFQGILASVGRSIKAISTTSNRHIGSQQDASQNSHAVDLLMSSLATSTGGTRDQDVEEMVHRLDQGVDKGDCKIPRSVPKSVLTVSSSVGMVAAIKPHAFNFVVSGEKCPIALDFELTLNGNETSGSGAYRLNYLAKDSDFRDLAGFDRVEMTGSMTYNGLKTADAVDLSYAFDAKGSGNSLLEGNIRTYLAIDASLSSKMSRKLPTGKSNVTFGLEFKDFTGELKVSTDIPEGGHPQIKRFINCREKTEDAFKEFLGTGFLE